MWNEHFQPLFAGALSARRVQQARGDGTSHRSLVDAIEKLLVFEGLRLTPSDQLQMYISEAETSRYVWPDLSETELFRSQFLPGIASYEALGNTEEALRC